MCAPKAFRTVNAVNKVLRHVCDDQCADRVTTCTICEGKIPCLVYTSKLSQGQELQRELHGRCLPLLWWYFRMESGLLGRKTQGHVQVLAEVRLHLDTTLLHQASSAQRRSSWMHDLAVAL